MDIYIKPAEKVQLVGKREVLLRDVAEVFSERTDGRRGRAACGLSDSGGAKKDVSPFCGGFDTGAQSEIPQCNSEQRRGNGYPD